MVGVRMKSQSKVDKEIRIFQKSLKSEPTQQPNVGSVQ